MPASRVQAGGVTGIIGAECTVRRCAGIATDERVRRIARQNRDVITFGRIQVNLAGINLRLLAACRTANTVADVADRRLSEDCLT